jgi:hypothetical protein
MRSASVWTANRESRLKSDTWFPPGRHNGKAWKDISMAYELLIVILTEYVSKPKDENGSYQRYARPGLMRLVY